jgi:uncharacterized membrane protein YbjE (DUF340 family)
MDKRLMKKILSAILVCLASAFFFCGVVGIFFTKFQMYTAPLGVMSIALGWLCLAGMRKVRNTPKRDEPNSNTD